VAHWKRETDPHKGHCRRLAGAGAGAGASAGAGAGAGAGGNTFWPDFVRRRALSEGLRGGVFKTAGQVMTVPLTHPKPWARAVEAQVGDEPTAIFGAGLPLLPQLYLILDTFCNTQELVDLVGRCRLNSTVSNPELKPRLVSAIIA
jgi:hypothetical protein